MSVADTYPTSLSVSARYQIFSFCKNGLVLQNLAIPSLYILPISSRAMANDMDIAVVALAISLVALFTTLLQLLQQYYATADGYRRCQKSVMAGWAKYTHRKFRWSEFRFETIFVVPDITFVDKSPAGSMGATNEDWRRSNVMVNFRSSEWGNGEYKLFREGWEIKTGWLGWFGWLINVFKIKNNNPHLKVKTAAAHGDEEQAAMPVMLSQRRKWNAEPCKAAL
jgi:hypothetical protein